jgi:serine/threonine protein kinase/WD40 repeat protein
MAVDAARAKSLFLAASDLADPAERAAYLDRECGGDAELRARVEALLRANDAAPLPPGDEANRTGPYRPNDPKRSEEHGDPTAHVGAVLAGRYKLVEEIGAGGMGSVFMAQQTEPVKRAVAVKVIKAGMDSRAVLARFEAERQALAMMDHPHIAKVLDAGTTDGGRPFFVMELVKGTPITQFCDERKLTPRQRLELFVPVCQAIQHAHQKGIIHRDIKPSNVLVALYDDRPVPKVIDFGVAKAAGQSLTDKTLMTGFGAIVGTPEYMSPEQASLNNLDIDTRSDVYALGVLLYELLTGTTPVDKKSLGKAALLEILRIVREVEAPRPSSKVSTSEALPSIAANRSTEPAKLSRLMKGELDWILLRALEKDRTRRYESANGFAADVQRYLAGEPVHAVPPSTGYRLKKFIKRNTWQVTAAAIIFLALLAGTVAASLGLFEARRQRDEANLARADADREFQNAIQANQALEASQGELQKTNQTLRSSQRELRSTLYSARMNLLRNALDARGGNALAWLTSPGVAGELLDLTCPDGKEDDPVGFEWHYLDRTLRGYLGQFPFGPFWSPQLSRDGTRGCCARLAFAGAVSDKGGIHVIDTATGKSLWHFPGQQEGFAYQIGMSPDGTHVAGVGCRLPDPKVPPKNPNRVRVWKVDTGAEVARFETPIAGECHICRLGPDNRTVVAIVGDRLLAWESATGRERFTCALGPKVKANVWFNPTGTELLVIRAKGTWHDDLAPMTDGSVELWDAGTGQTRVAFTGPFPKGVATAAISHDGRWVATAAPQGQSSEVKLWDAGTGKLIRSMTVAKAPGDNLTPRFLGMAFSPTGDRLAASCGYSEVDKETGSGFVIWEVATGEMRCFVPEDSLGASDNKPPIAFGADGALLYTGGALGFIWDATRDDRVKRGPVRVSVPGMLPLELVCSPSGDRFATLWSDGKPPHPNGPLFSAGAGPKIELRVGDITGRDVLRVTDLAATLPAKNDAKTVQTELAWRRVFFSPDGRKVACLITHATGPVEKYRGVLATLQGGPKTRLLGFSSFPSKEMQGRFRRDVQTRIDAARQELDKLDKFVICSRVRVWDLASGQELHGKDATAQYPTPSFLPISDAWFAPDGTKLTAIQQPAEPVRKDWILGGSRVATWDVTTGVESGSFTRDDLLFNQGTYAPDGMSMILAGRFAGCFRRVDTLRGHDLERIPTTHYQDGTVRILEENAWAINAPYDYYDLATHPQGRIRISPDGSQLFYRSGRDTGDPSVGSSDQLPRVTVFNLGSERPPTHYQTELALGRQAMAISPDGRRLVADGTITTKDKPAGGRVIVWDRASTRKLTHIDLPGPIRDMAFTPDSQRLGLLTSVDDGKAVEFHLLDGAPWPNRKLVDKLRR